MDFYVFYASATATKSLQSCPTLCNPTDGSPPGSPVPGILQARTLEWVAISFSNAWKWKVKGKSLSRVQLLATPWTAAHQSLCNPTDGSLPGSSVHGIFQARVLEWGAIAFYDFMLHFTVILIFSCPIVLSMAMKNLFKLISKFFGGDLSSLGQISCFLREQDTSWLSSVFLSPSSENNFSKRILFLLVSSWLCGSQ